MAELWISRRIRWRRWTWPSSRQHAHERIVIVQQAHDLVSHHDLSGGQGEGIGTDATLAEHDVIGRRIRHGRRQSLEARLDGGRPAHVQLAGGQHMLVQEFQRAASDLLIHLHRQRRRDARSQRQQIEITQCHHRDQDCAGGQGMAPVCCSRTTSVSR
jgi:hypothetical protein